MYDLERTLRALSTYPHNSVHFVRLLTYDTNIVTCSILKKEKKTKVTESGYPWYIFHSAFLKERSFEHQFKLGGTEVLAIKNPDLFY